MTDTHYRILKDHPLIGTAGDTISISDALCRIAAKEFRFSMLRIGALLLTGGVILGSALTLMATGGTSFAMPLTLGGSLFALWLVSEAIGYFFFDTHRIVRMRSATKRAQVTLQALCDNGYLKPA